MRIEHLLLYTALISTLPPCQGLSRSKDTVLTLRAGGEKKRKKKEINKVLQKDSAEALGDAIRDRADILRAESTQIEEIRHGVESIGWALGATDFRNVTIDSGGVEAASTSVLANYFLKSHGGAHGIQCVCSLLATFAGIGGILFTDPNVALTLQKRCLLFAMVKHVSGLLAGSIIAARAIPEIGIKNTRLWMEQLVADPVSQYVFYTSCLLVWLPSQLKAKPWWQNFALVMLGPVLLREIVSAGLVISDVLVLWSCSGTEEGSKQTVQNLLQMAHSMIDASMSVIMTAKKWRPATPAERQAILAKLVSRVSLALEIGVGGILALDASLASVAFIFGGTKERPGFLDLVKRLLCTRLFVQFLWTRKAKISRLATDIRGGAAQVPFHLLDVLMDPVAGMGLEKEQSDETQSLAKPKWKEYVDTALGLDDKQ